MNASNDMASTGSSKLSFTPAGDVEASTGFSSLEKTRQVLVFQTIQEAISAIPPRLDATFPRVVAAYISVSKVVEAASQGLLDEHNLKQLESDVDAAGGVIAPGLWSQGDNSISVFRSATFEHLRINFQAPVVDAAVAALNARLSLLKLNDLGRVFQVIATFFSPLTATASNSSSILAFKELDVDRQVLVFRTIQDASLVNPPRTEATFLAVVSAFQSEVRLLNAASCGELSDYDFEAFELSIEAAGGVLSPGTFAKGKQSIAAFRAETFKSLQPLLPAEVMASAVSALNARLREIRPSSLQALFKGVHTFFMPLLAQGLTSPTLQSFKTLDPHHQALVFRTVEIGIRTRPDLENTIFSSAVKAICAEQEILKASSIGKLTLPLLIEFKNAIELCGGFVEPHFRSDGEGSVGEFISSYFLVLKRDMPPEVSDAALSALNAKLQASSASNLNDVIRETRAFLDPLITVLQLKPLQPASSSTETLPSVEMLAIEPPPLTPPLELETPPIQLYVTPDELRESEDLEGFVVSQSIEPPIEESLFEPTFETTPSIGSNMDLHPSEPPESSDLPSINVGLNQTIVLPLEPEALSIPPQGISNEPIGNPCLQESVTPSLTEDLESPLSNLPIAGSTDKSISVPSGSTEFPISWVLVDELAVGPAPVEARHLDRLKAAGIASILSLCSTQERAEPDDLNLRFHCQRIVLPEPRTQGNPTIEQLEQALTALDELRSHGAVYVHCVAAVERSPLVCMAWLIQQHGVTRQHALDYMLQVHPGTSPSSDLLAILSELPPITSSD